MPARRKGKSNALNSGATPEALATIVSAESGTAIEAILVGGKAWTRRGKKAPIYGDEHGTFVSLGDPGSTLTSGEEERAWERVLALDDLSATSFLFVMARYLAENDDPRRVRYANIHINELLEYRGYAKHRNRDFRTEYKIAERDRILALSRIWVTVPNASRGRSKRMSRQSSQLVVATINSEDDDSQKTLPNLQIADVGVPYSFGVMLGAWADAYVEKQEARLILSAIMRYDPKDAEERIAMRLGLHLHFRPAQIIRVRDMLDGARLQIPTNHPERFRDSFESALGRLRDDGIIGGWAYAQQSDLPRYRWLDTWLSWYISISPSAVALVDRATNFALEPPAATPPGVEKKRSER